MAKVDITVKNRVEGEKQVAGLGKTFQNTVDTIKTGSAAVLAAGATFKKAFDLAKEGANIVQLGESFDILNESVLHTPDLLEDMRAAVRGTVSDTDLMQGVLKLTAGASDDMARRFAEAAPQLLEISKAAGKLNPTLGDTAFLYDSISTGIKRQSPLILDNLGIVIKVGEANEKYAQEVGKAVEELTAEEKQIALLNATMESGNKLIEQAGGSTIAAGDAYARMEVMVSGLVNTFKTWLGEGLTPVLEVLTGSYSDAAANVVKRNQEMDVTVDVLTNRMLKLSDATDIWLGLGQKITGTEEEITQSIKDTVIAIAEMSGSTEEMADNLLAAGASRDYFFNRLTALAALFPWELGDKADPFAPAPANIRPEWYFMFMFQTLKLVPGGEIFGIEYEALPILLFGLAGAVLVLVPFLDRGVLRKGASPGFTWFGVAALVFVIAMTAWGYHSWVPVGVAVGTAALTALLGWATRVSE